MTTQLRPAEEVAYYEADVTPGGVRAILTTDRDTAYTLLRHQIAKKKKYPCQHSPSDMCDTDCINQDDYEVAFARQVKNDTLDDILTLLDHIYGKTDALTK